MKKHLILTAVIVAAIAVGTPLVASAQIWNLNIYGGWSYSDISGARTVLTDGGYTSGFGGGVGAELRLNEDWGWEFGLWYIQKGTQGTFTAGNDNTGFFPEPTSTFDGTISLDYVQVPILVNVYFPVGRTADIRGFIGPTFAFLTNSNASGTLDGEPVDQGLSDIFDDADITVMIGAGGQWKLEKVNIMLNFAWDIGVTNISNVEGTEMRNNTVLITAAVGIPLSSGADD
jgi:hypothetical protein